MHLKYFVVVFLCGILYAASNKGNVGSSLINALCSIVNTIKAVIPAIVFLLVIAAALIYGVGQLLSAEMRSRASVWANTMIVGAIIALLIIILVPPILDSLLSDTGMSISNACGNSTNVL